MNERELDELLADSIAPLAPSVGSGATALASVTKPDRLRRGHMPRPRWLMPVIVAGTVALTGAASITTAQLAVWPWVSLPDGFERSIRIPIEYTTDEGHVEVCGGYVELRNTGAGDLAALDAAIRARDWVGFGQDLYDRGSVVADDPDSELRVGNELYPELVEMTREAIPGVLTLGESGDTVAIGAMGLSCRVDTP
ncbi:MULTISPECIES: hypothetical protein [unclassified Microbacterium]|uniref:hypothetical protein n=1 Tax=unclassified Microbacterium TaxID=2609290 RepID=UPI001604FD8D|nr:MULTISPECIES: hypothetical protein [unclassified Microbacterium]QNA92629.1 hypothetical protein G4G29_10000 [Microbacterium sp. Se63.02b]QYM65930.1 hypothetical protein K1X59_10035 [Microbacterium sp. Se5.02b]